MPPVITRKGTGDRVEIRDANGRCRVQCRLDDPVALEDGQEMRDIEVALVPHEVVDGN
jgi:hypothetical protein